MKYTYAGKRLHSYHLKGYDQFLVAQAQSQYDWERRELLNKIQTKRDELAHLERRLEAMS